MTASLPLRGLFGLALAFGVTGSMSLGCATVPGNSSVVTADGSKVWQAQVATVRIHPATRYRVHDGKPVLEARVELRDQMADPMKASAAFAFELATVGTTPGSAPHTLYRWQRRVATLVEQEKHYDAVTRAYVFPLEITDFVSAGLSTRLSVAVTLPDGRTLLDSAPLVVLQPSN